MNAREVVCRALVKVYADSAYSNLVLDHALTESGLSAQDKAFATALFYGVIEKQIVLDYRLSAYLKQPLKKLKMNLTAILRLGAYQLLFMQKVPHRAAINESVKLAKKCRCAYAAGMVNAVLRNLAKDGLVFPDKSDKNYLSIRYAVPQPLVALWLKDYGESITEGILSALEQKPPVVARVNTLLTTTADLLKRLREEGVEARENELLENAVILETPGEITKLAVFREGLFHIEDTAAQMAALLLHAKAGERVLDACAAPGGKSFTIAEQMGKGEILACDIYENRVRLIESGAKRLGLEIVQTAVCDASVFDASLGQFDKVLCDVPCSGLGIIRKKPEIRFKSMEEIAACAPLQYAILCNCFRYLKPGGTLVYSTCTLHKAENEDIVHRFAEEHACTLCYEKTYFPHLDGTDGFYAAVIEKK